MIPNKSPQQLAKGQIWKTEQTYVHIVERGKLLIHYKMMRELGKKAVRTQVSGIDAVEKYLKLNEAKLLKRAA
jgi:hypothetical protein